MPTQKPTGVKKPQPIGQPTDKQGQKLPSIRATIGWLNPDEDGSVRASASLTIGGAFAVHGVKVIDSAKGEFVSMPSYKSQNGYKGIFHAVTAEAREQMNEAVMKAYEQKLAEAQEQRQAGQEEAVDVPVTGSKGDGMVMSGM